jgi:hypothetical protein
MQYCSAEEFITSAPTSASADPVRRTREPPSRPERARRGPRQARAGRPRRCNARIGLVASSCWQSAARVYDLRLRRGRPRYETQWSAQRWVRIGVRTSNVPLPESGDRFRNAESGVSLGPRIEMILQVDHRPAVPALWRIWSCVSPTATIVTTIPCDTYVHVCVVGRQHADAAERRCGHRTVLLGRRGKSSPVDN